MKTAKSFVFSTTCAVAAGLIWATAATAAETSEGDAAGESVVPGLESSASFPEGAVGIVIAFKGQASATDAAGASRELKKNDPVRVGDTVSTGAGAYVVIEFVDGAKATIRPDSELGIDQYAYQTGNDGAVVNLIKGGLRAITGSIANERPESYKVKTSVATLGVRGTEFSLYVCEEDCR